MACLPLNSERTQQLVDPPPAAPEWIAGEARTASSGAGGGLWAMGNELWQ